MIMRFLFLLLCFLFFATNAQAKCITSASDIPSGYVVTGVIGNSHVTAPKICERNAGKFALTPLKVTLKRAFSGQICLTLDAKIPQGYRIHPGHRPQEHSSCGCKSKNNYRGYIKCVESYKAVVIKRKRNQK